MRRTLERVVFRRPVTVLHLGDFRANTQHRADEPVQLSLGFALGRLDHQGARHRERHGWRMEAVIHQALGDILLADPGLRFKRSQIENAFMGHATIATGVEHGKRTG